MHLTVPIDIQEWEVSRDEVVFPQSNEYRPEAATAPRDEQVQRAVALLKSAERPLIIAGSAASYSGSGDTLQRLIETTRIPFMTESSARGLVSDEHPYSAGFYDNGLNRAARKLREADVILLLGMKQDIIIGYTRPPTVSPEAKIVQVDPSPGEIGRNREVAVGIVGDVDDVVARMTDEAAKHTWSDLLWLDDLRGARAEQVAEMEVLAEPSVPIHALHVHKTLLSLIDEDDFLVFDGGDFCHWGRAYLPARTPRTWSYFSGLGMLGTAISTAMAAKLAHPERRAIVISGDGAFGFNALEYDTAVRHGIAITTVLGNDASWGIDRQDTTSGLRKARGHRPPARPVRQARRVPRRRRAVRASTRRSPRRPRPRPQLRSSFARQRRGAARHQSQGPGRRRPLEERGARAVLDHQSGHLKGYSWSIHAVPCPAMPCPAVPCVAMPYLDLT